MRNTIEKIRSHIKNREDLKPDSFWITLIVLFFIFLLAQIFGFTSRIEEEEKIVRIELRERTPPLKFARKNERPKRRKTKGPAPKAKTPNTAKTKRSEMAKSKTKSADISSLVKSFNPKQFMKSENNVRRTVNKNPSETTSFSKNLSRSAKSTVLANDLSLEVSSRPTAVPGGRRGAPSASESNSVDVGDASSGVGTVNGFSGGIAGGAGTGRATRSTGGGRGGATITFPGDGDGEEATLDIHDLIKWMKEHPGKIPRLVGYEMGHKQGDDLSSAVKFNMGGRSFTMFLSVNEKELLLRICLIENGDFTLLKDNGIKETSHFLTSGDVVYEASVINSLISSRRAPQDIAAGFYNIFWGWWEVERAKM
jgi:hypothetical protein